MLRVLGYSLHLQSVKTTSHHVGGSEVNSSGRPTDSCIVNLRELCLQARDTCTYLRCGESYGKVKSADEEDPSDETLSVVVLNPPISNTSPLGSPQQRCLALFCSRVTAVGENEPLEFIFRQDLVLQRRSPH